MVCVCMCSYIFIFADRNAENYKNINKTLNKIKI